MMRVYQLDSKELTESQCEYDYSRLDQCRCDSCESWSIWKLNQPFRLFIGILFPPIWIYCVYIIINHLYIVESQPLGVTEYLQIFTIKTRVQHDTGYEYLEEHEKMRDHMKKCLGHVMLAMVIYGLVVFTILMAFNDDVVVGRFV